MILETLMRYLLGKRAALLDHPFGPQPLVFKVGGKIFALLDSSSLPLKLSLKCEPAQAQFLRDSFPSVQPGYHLNKEHWNTVTIDGSIPDVGLQALIDDSYRLVFAGLTRAQRHQIDQSYPPAH